MNEFVVWIALAAVVLAGGVTALLLGVWAFVRTSRLNRALQEAHARIDELEEVLIRVDAHATAPTWAAAQAHAPAPAPHPAPEPAMSEAGAPILPFEDLPRSAPVAPYQAPPTVDETVSIQNQPEDIARRVSETTSTGRWLGAGMAGALILVLLALGVQTGALPSPVLMGLGLACGAGLLAAAEWLRRRTDLAPPMAMAVAAGLSVAAFALAIAAGRGSGQDAVLQPIPALALLALVGAAGVALGLRFGPWPAAAGLAVGYLAPLAAETSLAGAATLPIPQFGYLAALTGLALGVIKGRRWRAIAWIAAIGALGWGFAAVIGSGLPGHVVAASWYAVVLTALGLAYAWEEASAPLPFGPSREPRPPVSEAMALGHVLALGAAAVLTFALTHPALPPSGPPALAVAAMATLCAIAASAGALRDGFVALPLAAAVAAVLALAGLPQVEDGRTIVNLPVLLGFSGALGFIFSVGGWAMMARNVIAGPGALLCAIGPVLVLAAAHQASGGFAGPMIWGGSAVFLAAANVLTLERILRAYGASPSVSLVTGAYAVGATLAAALAIAIAFTGVWQAAVLALLLPLLAWIDRRMAMPGLKVAAAAVAALVLVRLIWPGFLAEYDIARTPFLNALLPGYGLAIAGFFAASRMFDRSKGPNDTRLVQGLEAGALALTAALLSMQVRHLANDGQITAPYSTLFEMAGHSAAWLGFAGALALRYGPKPRPLIFWAETIAFGAAAGHFVLLGVLMVNPWWGVAPAAAPGLGPLANAVTAAYGGSALLLLLYGRIRRRQGMTERAALAEILAAAAAFLWLTLEVRRAFQGSDLSAAGVEALEGWAYCLAWLCFAGLLFALGAFGRRIGFRYAALALASAATVKGFLFDLQTDGFARIAAIVALLGVLGLLVAGFQRYALGRSDDAEPGRYAADPPQSS